MQTPRILKGHNLGIYTEIRVCCLRQLCILQQEVELCQTNRNPLLWVATHHFPYKETGSAHKCCESISRDSSFFLNSKYRSELCHLYLAEDWVNTSQGSFTLAPKILERFNITPRGKLNRVNNLKIAYM